MLDKREKTHHTVSPNLSILRSSALLYAQLTRQIITGTMLELVNKIHWLDGLYDTACRIGMKRLMLIDMHDVVHRRLPVERCLPSYMPPHHLPRICPGEGLVQVNAIDALSQFPKLMVDLLQFVFMRCPVSSMKPVSG